MKLLFENNKVFRLFIIILLVIIVLSLVIFMFIKLMPTFGKVPDINDKKDYAKRSSNYKDGKFYNEADFSLMNNAKEKNKFLSKKDAKPKTSIPVRKLEITNKLSKENLRITWLGHSSLLIQISGLNILFDPVFSDVASPVSFAGPKRFSKVPIKTDELPKIDFVIITHDHYDHLDYNTIKKIDSKVGKYIVPLGIENHLERWNIKKSKIINMAWWEEIKVDDLLIACTPSRHFSGRSIGDQFNTLWASFVLKNNSYTVFDSGDTGYNSFFKEIASKYGPFDLAMLDSGQYNVRWPNVHMKPKESVKAAIDLNTKVAMPIHYGAFKLSSHPWDDPVSSFTYYANKVNLEYVTPLIGETFEFKEYKKYKKKWWENIK